MVKGDEQHTMVVSQWLKVVVYDNGSSVMKQLDPIKKFYNLYSEEEDSPRIVEVMDDDLDLDSDLGNGSANLYLEL